MEIKITMKIKMKMKKKNESIIKIIKIFLLKTIFIY